MLTVAAATVVLLIAIILDSDHFSFMVRPEVQAIAGIFVVAVLLFDNVVSGLVLGIAVLIMYMRVYSSKYNITWNSWATTNLFGDVLSNNSSSMKGSGRSHDSHMNPTVRKYVTPADLEDAQNNVVDNQAFNTPGVGISGHVFGAQGTADRDILPAFDNFGPGSEIKMIG